MKALCTVLCAAVVLSGCGGGGGRDDESAIRGVLDRFEQARTDDAGGEACRELLVIREAGRSTRRL